MMNDLVADCLARLRNAGMRGHSDCAVRASIFVKKILDVLVREGYLEGYAEKEERKGVKNFVVSLRYHRNKPVISMLQRVSKLGRRVYKSSRSLRPLNNGLGIWILTTSHGVLSDREALKLGVGGEVVCGVY